MGLRKHFSFLGWIATIVKSDVPRLKESTIVPGLQRTTFEDGGSNNASCLLRLLGAFLVQVDCCRFLKCIKNTCLQNALTRLFHYFRMFRTEAFPCSLKCRSYVTHKPIILEPEVPLSPRGSVSTAFVARRSREASGNQTVYLLGMVSRSNETCFM